MHAPYQTGPDGHRGTRAVQRLVEYAPATGSLALWMRHRDVEEMPRAAGRLRVEHTDGDWLLGNDGATIWYGPAFERRPLTEQTGLVAHQVLHVSLRHVPRERALREVLGDVDAALFNLCADAIVNAALSHLDWLALPADAVRLDEVLSHLPVARGHDRRPLPDTGSNTGSNTGSSAGSETGPNTSTEASLLHWSTESLYRAIDDRRADAPSRGARPDGRTTGATHTAGGKDNDRDDDRGGDRGVDRGNGGRERPDDTAQRVDPSTRKRRDGSMRDGPISAAVRPLAGARSRDLFTDGDSPPEREADTTRRWSERLARAHASDGAQSLLRTLLADRTTPRTPWELLLRTRLNRHLAQQPALSWSRPSRSWLANRGRTAGGRRLPWQPGTSASRAVPRLCLIVDVSGSIEAHVLGRFSSELERLMRLHRAEIRLIVGDDQVRHERLLRPGRGDLDALAVEGGGGTDFAPLLAAADRHHPDLTIVLTDLEGPAGEPPAWPVLWALLPEHPGRAVPFGRAITLT